MSNEEMQKIQGGGINWSIVSFAGAALALLAGVVDGFFRPLRCN